MPGRRPPCYAGTDIAIQQGDCVAVVVHGKAVIGVVKTASARSRRIEVWVPREAVTHPQARWRSYRRVEVTPLPGRPQGDWRDNSYLRAAATSMTAAA